jgi:hypothetical protein
MKTIFGVFDSYRTAQAGVKDLGERGFDEKAINVITQEATVRNESGFNQRTAPVAVTGDAGDSSLHGLDRLVGGKQAVRVLGIGEVIKAGDLADVVVSTAIAPGEMGSSLVSTLHEFGVPPDKAVAYENGVMQGGVLLFVRTNDEQIPEAVQALESQNAREVYSV